MSWVRLTDPKGNVTEYTAAGSDPAAISKLEQRRMDCVDCHNRPTHVYLPPDRAVDQAMAANRISPTLPFAKQQGVQILTAEYKTTDEAKAAIAEQIPAFYQQKYPQLAKDHAGDIQNMVTELQRIFRENIFPEMKVDWRTHPDNVGHYYFNGCFRCHDGNHTSKDGKVITKECNSCHTVLVRGRGRAAGRRGEHRHDLQAPHRPGRPDRRQLLRLPQRRSRTVAGSQSHRPRRMTLRRDCFCGDAGSSAQLPRPLPGLRRDANHHGRCDRNHGPRVSHPRTFKLRSEPRSFRRLS